MSNEPPSPARPEAPSGSTPSCTVLLVCTGNICRSPAAERLLAAGLGAPADIRVTSAGTHALVGSPISGPMVPLLRSAGASAEDFVARQLDEDLIRGSDVVLAMTREHRSRVVELHPAAVRRTFTLRELARIIEGIDPALLPDASPAERLRALIPLATARRARAADPPADDVVDPYRRERAVYARSFDQLRPAVDTLVRALRG